MAIGDEHHGEVRFQRIAANYDHANRVLSLGLDRLWRQQAVSVLQRCPGETTLDLCCGTGEIIRELVDQQVPGRLLGLDLSEAMLRCASHKLPVRQHGIELIQGDALATPFSNEEFDSVICGFGLRNLPDRTRGLREMRRILRPGGRLVLLEFIPPPAGLRGWPARTWIKRAVPLLGRTLTGDKEAYDFLARSVTGFATLPQLAAEMASAGFAEIEGRALFPGVVAVWSGVAA